jgi:hypothetical protein
MILEAQPPESPPSEAEGPAGSGRIGRRSIAVLPDALAGQRLAGTAADCEAMRASLSRLGANPLLVDAFRRRSTAFAVR